MDSVKAEKLQAMEKYRRSQFPQMLLQFALRVVLLGLFMSSPNWVPLICSCVKFFFVVSLPNMGAMVTRPKFIFMVTNIIIVFLVGESRLSKSAAQPDVYGEYAAVRAQSLQSASTVEVKEKEEEQEAIFIEPLLEETKDKDEKPEEEEEEEAAEEQGKVAKNGDGEEEEDEEEEAEEQGKVAKNGDGEEEEDEEEEEEEEKETEQRQELEEEEEGLPAEELNKRVEEFISKVNMQRKLEAKMLICYE